MKTSLADCRGVMAPRRATLEVERKQLSYLEWGANGRPLFLLHGITSNAWGWWRVAPALVAAGYHVYALDMPGHGESELYTDHRIAALADLIGAALGRLAPGGYDLLGHSWGGAVALMLAVTAGAGNLVRRLVLEDPAMRMDSTWGASVLPRYSQGLGMHPDVTRPALRKASPDWHPCDIFWKAEALRDCRPEMVRGFFAKSGDWELTPLLAQVHVPLLLLVANPPFTVVAPEVLAAAERMLAAGHGQLQTLAGTDHNMHRGGYDVFMAALRDWLQAE